MARILAKGEMSTMPRPSRAWGREMCAADQAVAKLLQTVEEMKEEMDEDSDLDAEREKARH